MDPFKDIKLDDLSELLNDKKKPTKRKFKSDEKMRRQNEKFASPGVAGGKR